MTPEHRVQLQIARTQQHGEIMRTTLTGLVAIAAIIGFGAADADLPLIIVIVAVSLYGILGGGTALDDIAALRDDMDAATAGSAYGRQAKARNLGLLKMMSSGLIGLTGVAEIIAVLVT